MAENGAAAAQEEVHHTDSAVEVQAAPYNREYNQFLVWSMLEVIRISMQVHSTVGA